MLKEAIEKIVALAAPTIREIEGAIFSVNSDGEASEIHPDVVFPDKLELHSLDALVKMIQQEAAAKYVGLTPFYITVPNHLTAKCFLRPLEGTLRELRPTLYEAVATDVPGWAGGDKLGFEEAMIALRTRFEHTPDTDYALKLLSDITTGSKITLNDNGIATSVVSRSGIALQENQTIRPIISLRPYRTFQEVEQPASDFLIRVSERGISFTEADGGMWKLKARETVKSYLEYRLAAETESGTVVIAL